MAYGTLSVTELTLPFLSATVTVSLGTTPLAVAHVQQVRAACHTNCLGGHCIRACARVFAFEPVHMFMWVCDSLEFNAELSLDMIELS